MSIGTLRTELLVALGLGLAALALYVATAAPDMVGGDAGEFQFVPPLLGIAHHTGYPLYTLVGALWSLLPIGTVAYRMNLLSALFAAAAVAAAYLCAVELSGRRATSVLASCALGASFLFWKWSTVAGVRSSTALMSVIVIYAAIHWGKYPGPSHRHFYLLALALGVALAHHRSAALMVLPLFAYVLLVNRRILLEPMVVLRAALFGLLPLLSYLYLPLRSALGAPFDQFHPDTLAGFYDLVVAARLSGEHLSAPTSDLSRWSLLAGELRNNLGTVGLVLAMIGGAWQLVRRPAAFVLLALFAIAIATQTVTWNTGKTLNTVYLLPLVVVVALWIAEGASALGNCVAKIKVLSHIETSGAVAAVILSVPFVQLAHFNWDELHRLANRPLDKFRLELDAGFMARRLVLESLPHVEDDAVIFGDWDQATAFWYAEKIEGIKPGVEFFYGITTISMDESKTKSIPINEITRAARGRPIYLARTYPDTGNHRLSAVGPLVKLLDRPQTNPPPGLVPLNLTFGSELRLLGYTLYDQRGRETRTVEPNAAVIPMTLYWQALSAPQADYSVSVRLVDDRGAPKTQLDNKHPVLSMYPTSRWTHGEVVGDYYELPVGDIGAGSYGLRAVLYRSTSGGWHNLPVTDEAGHNLGEQGPILDVALTR